MRGGPEPLGGLGSRHLFVPAKPLAVIVSARAIGREAEAVHVSLSLSRLRGKMTASISNVSKGAVNQWRRNYWRGSMLVQIALPAARAVRPVVLVKYPSPKPTGPILVEGSGRVAHDGVRRGGLR